MSDFILKKPSRHCLNQVIKIKVNIIGSETYRYHELLSRGVKRTCDF